ncbi:MAG: hypothetical protein H8E25_15335 [Planctomycetes bacterium]|nr:hypothetical protein [Planctomycetota bacterium]
MKFNGSTSRASYDTTVDRYLVKQLDSMLAVVPSIVSAEWRLSDYKMDSELITPRDSSDYLVYFWQLAIDESGSQWARLFVASGSEYELLDSNGEAVEESNYSAVLPSDAKKSYWRLMTFTVPLESQYRFTLSNKSGRKNEIVIPD